MGEEKLGLFSGEEEQEIALCGAKIAQEIVSGSDLFLSKFLLRIGLCLAEGGLFQLPPHNSCVTF